MNMIKGDCEFQKIYRWDSESQQWVKITGDDLIEKIGNGIVVKAKAKCNLNHNTIQSKVSR